MPQLTSIQTMQIPTAPSKHSRWSAAAPAARVRVGTACDRARLEQARRRCWAHIAAPRRACLYAVLAVCGGQSLHASAAQFCVPIDALHKCCNIINNAGAETFLTMLTNPDAEWHVPELHLPQQHKRRRSSGLMPAPMPALLKIVTPPLVSPDLKPMTPPLLTPPLTPPCSTTPPLLWPAAEYTGEMSAEGCQIQRLQTPVAEQDEQTRLQAVKQAIEAFAAQDPELFTSHARPAPIDRGSYLAGLPTLEMLDDDPALWVHSPLGNPWAS